MFNKTILRGLNKMNSKGVTTFLTAAATIATLGYAGDALAKQKSPVPPTPGAQQQLFEQRAKALAPHCVASLESAVCQTGLKLLHADMDVLPEHHFLFMDTQAVQMPNLATPDVNDTLPVELRVYMQAPGKAGPVQNLIPEGAVGPVNLSDGYKTKSKYTVWADLFNALRLNQDTAGPAKALVLFNYANSDNPSYNRTLDPETVKLVFTTDGNIWDIVSSAKKDTRGKSLRAIRDSKLWMQFSDGDTQYNHLMIPTNMLVRVPNNYILGMYEAGGLKVPQQVIDFVMQYAPKDDAPVDLPKDDAPVDLPKDDAPVDLPKEVTSDRDWFLPIGAGYTGFGGGAHGAYLSAKLDLPKFNGFWLFGLDLMLAGGKSSDSVGTPDISTPNPEDPMGLYGGHKDFTSTDTTLLDLMFTSDLRFLGNDKHGLYFALGLGIGIDLDETTTTTYEKLFFAPNTVPANLADVWDSANVASEGNPISAHSTDIRFLAALKLGLAYRLLDTVFIEAGYRGRVGEGPDDHGGFVGAQYLF